MSLLLDCSRQMLDRADSDFCCAGCLPPPQFLLHAAHMRVQLLLRPACKPAMLNCKEGRGRIRAERLGRELDRKR